MQKRLFLLLILAGFTFLPAVSQNPGIPETELRLQALASEILNHPSLEHKKARNREFAELLIQTLSRPESYSYPFDSLKTLSILKADDGSFRLFTWHIADKKDPDANYGDEVFYYFGLVQRKYEVPGQETEYIVIPLLNMGEIPTGIENMLLDNTNWLGGQYYPARYHENIPSASYKYYDPKQRTTSGKIKKEKIKYYILFGWNGMDNRSNLKFVDVMSFDPKQKDRVIFGANVFYFDRNIPKYRALFKYSEYAPFSLNYSYVKEGISKKKMIVYDHLASPKPGDRKLTEIWEMGPDG
ncbi:MAG: hypothetical protein EAZ89_02520, partial [Bacteroidetes bacterium]